MPARPVLQQADIERALTRIAHEILEAPAPDPEAASRPLVLLGIPTRGVLLADRLGMVLERLRPGRAAVGALDVTMYRDDLARQPIRTPQPTRVPDAGVDGATVVLVDDVLFSGRTIRAALDAINDLGRPRAVRLAVLVDRGHRELPIRPDFVGKNLPSAPGERVNVHLAEIDGVDEVVVS
jgi:pyrimidine operon attenuation protein/uracil phosphoribosyltransferase